MVKVMMRMLSCVLLALLLACGRRDPRSSIYPRERKNYRLLKDVDFCGELALFAEPDPTTMIGTVLDGAQHYVDPTTGKEFKAVSVLPVIDGKRVDRWYRRDALVRHVYMYKGDPDLRDCNYWLDREERISPSEFEIPAK